MNTVNSILLPVRPMAAKRAGYSQYTNDDIAAMTAKCKQLSDVVVPAAQKHVNDVAAALQILQDTWGNCVPKPGSSGLLNCTNSVGVISVNAAVNLPQGQAQLKSMQANMVTARQMLKDKQALASQCADELHQAIADFLVQSEANLTPEQRAALLKQQADLDAAKAQQEANTKALLSQTETAGKVKIIIAVVIGVVALAGIIIGGLYYAKRMKK